MRGLKYAAVLAVMTVMVWSLAGCGIPKSEYEKLEKKYDTVQREIKSFNTQAKKIQQDNESLKKTNDDLTRKLKKMTSEKAALEKANQSLTNEKISLQKKLTKAQSQAKAKAKALSKSVE
ncbi:MAG: hypothetical protein ISS33_06640 [Candidatus Omnitrophica bacterium]|nr:hypothetical protein [Candidatus Omnitrophota bacterium]